MSVEQVLCAAGRRLGASSVGDRGRCQAVLYVLVHVHSGWPRLPVEMRQREFNSQFNILTYLIIKRPLFALAENFTALNTRFIEFLLSSSDLQSYQLVKAFSQGYI